MGRPEIADGPRPWTRADVLTTLFDIGLQVVVWTVVALAAGGVWSRFDGSSIPLRFGNSLAIAGAICLLGAGTVASKVTHIDYMRWGISSRNESLFGDDIGSADLGLLTPLGEAFVTSAILFGLSIVVG